MTPSGLFRKYSLPLSVFVLVAMAAKAQAPPKYDPASETTVKGTVSELKMIPPTGTKSFAYLSTRIGPDKDKDVVQVFLCPKKFLDDMGITFKTDDSIQVTGSRVKQDGNELILAREMVKGGETITFRFQDGKPAW
ncbi:MAG TPA: hypothetical protein VHW45_00260 [Candidatus Sulfotelmatobacter sp.]|jgi:hypothetical protein|nr:hypothetical protein [Candidatus Sulfotelmatobacter sp.]